MKIWYTLEGFPKYDTSRLKEIVDNNLYGKYFGIEFEYILYDDYDFVKSVIKTDTMLRIILDYCPSVDLTDLNCADVINKIIYVNPDRYYNGELVNIPEYTLYDYHVYILNHEIGHILGFDHPSKSGDCDCEYGELAPIMCQQSRGLNNCKSNIKELTNRDKIRFKN
jgi:hypothetical protein